MDLSEITCVSSACFDSIEPTVPTSAVIGGRRVPSLLGRCALRNVIKAEP